MDTLQPTPNAGVDAPADAPADAPSGAAGTGARRRWRAAIAAMGALLLIAFGAVGLLQVRQFELLNATQRYQDDYLVWSLFQFEVEYLKLRLQLEQAAGPSLAVDAEAIEQRYEIFVSRVSLLESEHATKILADDPEYRHTLARTREFIRWADALPLDARLVREQPERLREAQERMDGLAEAIRALSLTASHHVAAQVTERNAVVRQQNLLSIALTVLQCALIFVFALIIVRQFRRLDRYGREQQALAENLQQARHEAEAGSRAKSVFLANMSHELRTPMHGLLGMLALLKDSELSGSQQTRLHAANDSARHLLAVLNDILDVSKMEAGGIAIQPEPVQLARLLRELEELTWPQANAKGLDLAIRLDDDIPPWVMADPTRLRQILLNLLSNAIKFSVRGRVALLLTRQSDALGESLLRFEVSDTGIGMDAATLAKLFQRFSQGDATSSRRFGGAGLGLEISRNLARAMGGDIHVVSEPDRGSIFTLELRLPACAAPVLPAATSDAPAAAARRLRILVSEDNETNRAFLEAVLQRLGHRARFCANGFEALQCLKAEDFDLVLMDLHTPVLDGYEATTAMRALPGPKGSVRIVALSADAFDESRERALRTGMDDFLAKPVGIEALTAALARHALDLPASDERAVPPSVVPPDGTNHVDDVDAKTVAELRGNLPDETVRRLYATFAAELPAARARLAQALERRERAALQEAAHSLKGAAANLGIALVAGPALALERSARTAQTPDWERLARATEALLAAMERSTAVCAAHGLI